MLPSVVCRGFPEVAAAFWTGVIGAPMGDWRVVGRAAGAGAAGFCGGGGVLLVEVCEGSAGAGDTGAPVGDWRVAGRAAGVGAAGCEGRGVLLAAVCEVSAGAGGTSPPMGAPVPGRGVAAGGC
ncbi:hypothetical protein [Streptomyces alboniger]|uniref:Glyoxalase-like domain-containing protein n=1 Tax=Streptomyces alboniger TaxID=132473 RepID=A0A5J6HQV4_STRAD|nr:hypothetical protein [Streptomyces alboniger]QEV20823.1 hypothetical protein CP975_27680 [Streptomyces alboniger]